VEDNLPGVLDGDDEPVTVHELEEVVRRASQRRQATLVAGAAALLALGAVGGAIARGPSDDRRLGVAGQGETTTTGQSVRGWASGPPFGTHGMAGTYTSLFRREANGIAVRAYRIAVPSGPAPVDPACAGPSSFVQAELSSAAAVGVLFAPDIAAAARPEGTGLVVLAADSFGVAEGGAATSAVVRSGPGIATVRLTTPSGSDIMAPQDGMTVLAVGGLADDGTVEGLAPNGEVVVTRPIIGPPPQRDEPLPMPPAVTGEACGTFPCVAMPTTPGAPELVQPQTSTTLATAGGSASAPASTAAAAPASSSPAPPTPATLLLPPPPDRIEVHPCAGTSGVGAAPVEPGATTTWTAPPQPPGTLSTAPAPAPPRSASPTVTAAPSGPRTTEAAGTSTSTTSAAP